MAGSYLGLREERWPASVECLESLDECEDLFDSAYEAGLDDLLEEEDFVGDRVGDEDSECD